MTILLGDCLNKMKEMDDNSIDFIVTDSPYGISFMSKKWDQQIPPIEYWREMLRICKPGSMMACAGLPRMYHRLACVVEDAGWKIKDCVLHLFGSGFPKAHNFGKKLGGEWEGYSSCGLKPAYEPWVICEKPIDKNYAHNAEKWGVAGINVDESRIGTDQIKTHLHDRTAWHGNKWGAGGYEASQGYSESRIGRWPSNLLLSEQAADKLDQMTGIQPSRFFYCAKASSSERNKGLEGMPLKDAGFKNSSGRGIQRGDAYTEIKKQNNHPTVKPIALMRYLLKLLAPPGDPIVLDPFCGSGSTLIAAKELGIRFIGIEKEPEYHAIAEARVKAASKLEEQLHLFP